MTDLCFLHTSFHLWDTSLHLSFASQVTRHGHHPCFLYNTSPVLHYTCTHLPCAFFSLILFFTSACPTHIRPHQFLKTSFKSSSFILPETRIFKTWVLRGLFNYKMSNQLPPPCHIILELDFLKLKFYVKFELHELEF